jgi:hypothetical protein
MKAVFLRFPLLFFCCFSYLSNASNLVLPGCDTLFSSDGKQYMIRLLETNADGIIFATCNEPNGERYSLPKEKIIRIGKSNDGDISSNNARKDPLARQARSAMILSIIGASMLGLFSIFGIPGLVLLAIGIVKGEKVLRKLAEIKDHPFEKKIRRQARAAILLGLLMLIIPTSVYLLFILLL